MGALLRAAAVRQRPCVVPHRGWVCARAAICGAHNAGAAACTRAPPTPTHSAGMLEHARWRSVRTLARGGFAAQGKPRLTVSTASSHAVPRHTPPPPPPPPPPTNQPPRTPRHTALPPTLPILHEAAKRLLDCGDAVGSNSGVPRTRRPLAPAATRRGFQRVGRGARRARTTKITSRPRHPAQHAHCTQTCANTGRERPRTRTTRKGGGRWGAYNAHTKVRQRGEHTHTCTHSQAAALQPRDSCSGAPPTRSTSHTHDNAGEAEAQAGKK
jgi:hypothetical protein